MWWTDSNGMRLRHGRIERNEQLFCARRGTWLQCMRRAMVLDEEAPWWLFVEVRELCRGRFASDEHASSDDELRCQHFKILECHQQKGP